MASSGEEVIEQLPAPVRAVLVQVETIESEQRNLVAAGGLSPTEKRIYDLLSAEEPPPINDLVKTTGLNSSEVLATLFDLEMKGITRQLPEIHFIVVGGVEAAASAQCIGKNPLRIRSWALGSRRYSYKGSEKDTLRPASPSSGRN